MSEETFGPVVGVAPFDDREEALRLANGTRYGLAGFVFSRDLAVALNMAERLEAGSVWVNNIQRSRNDAPFGGHEGERQSGARRAVTASRIISNTRRSISAIPAL